MRPTPGPRPLTHQRKTEANLFARHRNLGALSGATHGASFNNNVIITTATPPNTWDLPDGFP